MSRPGFRKGTSGGGPGRFAGTGPAHQPSGPFSQAQILRLMKTEFARARRHGFAIGCILMHMDRLTQLVDLHGSELRAEVRQALHKMVAEKTRGADHLGLVEEDRYLMILPHTALDATLSVAQRIHSAFRELEVTADGKTLALTLSMGVSATADQSTLFFDTLLEQAELALDTAIRRGGDRIVPFQRQGGSRTESPDAESPQAGSRRTEGPKTDADRPERPPDEAP